jgi:hypothetical protein
MPPSGTLEVTLSSRLRRPMLRLKPRMNGGTTALTASVRRKPQLPSLVGLGGVTPLFRELRAALVILPCRFNSKKNIYISEVAGGV